MFFSISNLYSLFSTSCGVVIDDSLQNIQGDHYPVDSEGLVALSPQK